MKTDKLTDTVLIKGKDFKFDKKITFDKRQDVFGALYDAQDWLNENGYSYGSSCVNCPTGIMFGDYFIAKWRNLDKEDIEGLHGVLVSGRDMPTTIYIK